MITQPDASGGLGSIPRDLWNVVTGGLQAAVRGEVIKRYGFDSFTDTPTVNANGEVRPAAAPSSAPKASDRVMQALDNPLVLVALAALGALVIARLVRA